MSESTKKKMLEWLSRVEYLTNRYAKNSREDDRRFQILHRLIENMDKKVSREFVEKWMNGLCHWAHRPSRTKKAAKNILICMLAELGYEIEEEEEK
jgi:hypothetical protein